VRRRALLLSLAVAGACCLVCGPAGARPAAATAFPIRAAFYYPWYPGAWKQQGMNPFTRYHPSLGLYNGGSPAVVAEQAETMQSVGLNALIASWFGPGSSTDAHIPTVVAALRRPALANFKFALYYEVGKGLPSVAKMRADLTYALQRYAVSKSYLRVGGKPVLFVYNASSDGASCNGAAELEDAAAGRFYLDLKVFVGFRDCPAQPSSWHQYGPAERESHVAGYSDSISPGFFKASESTPRLPRDLAAWAKAAKDMALSHERWQLVTTFNEWGEGTAVEQSREWGTSYLDALRTALRGRVAKP
jgi:hypothetical protein